MTDDTSLLRITGCEHPERFADVIFVHGLDGDARTTWHPKGVPDAFWPAWLGDQLPEVGIWSLDYAASSLAWKGNSMPLYDRADNILDLVEDAVGQRPLAFVCHSLGGLLIKQMLRNASEARNPRWQAIARQTRLIVFLSTPHTGANMASWIQYLGTLLRTTVSVAELEAHHPRLRELNDWYRDHVESLGVQTFVYYETRPTAGILVVDATTANPGLAGVRPIALDEDHVSICKPTSTDSRVYRRVQRLLEDMLSNQGRGAAPAPQAATGAGWIKLEVCRRLLYDWQEVADYLEIPSADRAHFSRGDGPRGVWEWLEVRQQLPRLNEALQYLGRPDLVEILRSLPR